MCSIALLQLDRAFICVLNQKNLHGYVKRAAFDGKGLITLAINVPIRHT